MTGRSRGRRVSLRVAGLLCLLAPGVPAAGHEVRPAYLGFAELAPGRYEVAWKVPARSAGFVSLAVVLPESCREIDLPRIDDIPGARVRRTRLDCRETGLVGQEIAVDGLRATLMDVLVRLELRDGTVHTHLLRPASPAVILGGESEAPERPAVPVRGYLRLGVEHILLGVDHLLFVLALLLIVPSPRRLLQTITAFTVAHSLTLAAASLGWVRVPTAPVEAVIALSIVFVASELLGPRRGGPRQSLTARHPWMVAFAFGLLHGFGFAGALSEVGLPPAEVPLALLLFNLGVEVGQLVFVALAGLVIVAWRRSPLSAPPWVEPVPAYAIGSLASYWLIERVSQFF